MSAIPTLRDVAELAGVSTATVSRCLNSPEKVVEETRKKVLAAVSTLGYAPNFSAQSLAANRTRTIGAIIPTMANAIFAEGIQAFQDQLQTHGYTLLIASSSYDPEQEAKQIRSLVARGADGLLLIGQERDDAQYGFLETQKVSVVTAWSQDLSGRTVSLGFDNQAAMRELVSKAMSMGHRKIGMISAPAIGNDRAAKRQMALRDMIGDDLPLVETSYGFAEGGAAFEDLMATHPELTLIMAGNDILAAGAMRRAKELGIFVPDRVSITGFDDIGLADLLGITTVQVPHRQMGEAAADALVSLVEGNGSASQTLPTRLCLRESLGVPRSLA